MCSDQTDRYDQRCSIEIKCIKMLANLKKKGDKIDNEDRGKERRRNSDVAKG